MMSNETISTLRYHAGWEHVPKSEVPCLAEAIWNEGSLQRPIESVLDAFNRMNIEMNGPIPSAASRKQELFPRSVLAAVDEIFRVLRQASRERRPYAIKEGLETVTRRLEIAWSAVLDGDIDDLSGHISDEERARSQDTA